MLQYINSLDARRIQNTKTLEAICVLKEALVSGIIRFQQDGNQIHVMGDVYSLTPGKHGIHIHEFGDISVGCITTGDHYNPHNLDHGGPYDMIRHVGDLGNITADKMGHAHIDFYDAVILLEGCYSIIGRSIVVHQKQDDLGRGSDPTSKKNGNSGEKIACGVIGYSH